MNHDEIVDLLGAYALDAVDDDERAAIEAHLTACARCRAEVQEHREVATLLAHSGGEAPAGVWQRIAGALDEAPPELRLASVDEADAPPRPSPWMRRLLVGAAAAAVVVIAVLGVQVRQQHQRLDELQTALQDPLSRSYRDALAEPGSERFELRSEDGLLTLPGAVTDDGTGYLQASELPALDGERTYQLWGAAGDQLVSLGVLGARPGTVSFPADRYASFAITEERTPGVVVSANPPVVAGRLG